MGGLGRAVCVFPDHYVMITHQQRMRVLVVPCPPQHVLFSAFSIFRCSNYSVMNSFGWCCIVSAEPCFL